MSPKNIEGSSTALNLESSNTEYKNLLIEYKQAVSNYVNYLKQEIVQPCAAYNANSKGISQACYNDIWKKAGCGTGTIQRTPDSNKSCEYWASIGECNKNPNYMLQNCTTSCNNVKNNTNSNWAKSQTLNGLIQDSWSWATKTDTQHRNGCYGKNNKKYNTSTAPNFNINASEMTSLKGTAFWGTSALSQSKVSTVGQCQALCSKTSGCSGATYNQTSSLCSLRKGDANIVAGSPTDYSIVPKAKSLLKIVQGINDKLTQVNGKIQTLSQTAEKEFNTESGNRTTSNTNLLNQYKNLVVERNKIKNMLDEYQTLDEKQNEGDIQISQNYYSFILLMILAILFIYLLYKFSGPSAESTTTFVQNGGELGTSAYYMIFGFFVLILLLTCYNKYKLL
jgi:hypothetical protein